MIRWPGRAANDMTSRFLTHAAHRELQVVTFGERR